MTAPQTLADRVRSLVERSHDGNMARAAKAWGMSATQVRGMASGAISDPSCLMVSRISDAEGVTVHWLVTGREHFVRPEYRRDGRAARRALPPAEAIKAMLIATFYAGGFDFEALFDEYDEHLARSAEGA